MITTKRQQQQQASDEKVHSTYQLAMAVPGMCPTIAEAVTMQVCGIKSRGTVWRARNRVERKGEAPTS